MKNLLLFLSFLFFVFSVYGQSSIPNGNFEQWTSGTYENPQYYPISSNASAFFRTNTAFNVTKTIDSFHGTYAVQVATITSANDTVFGYFLNTNPNGSPSGWTGGMAYNQRPTGIRGYYKYNATADSATILVAFSHAGINIGTYTYRIGGIKNTYTLFNFTFNPALTTTPDSVIFGAISCKLSNSTQQPHGIPGSILKIDSVSFTGVSSQPLQMNGDFELWQSQTVYKPNSWYYGGDDQGDGMFRTTDAFAGNYAMELTTYLRSNNNNNQIAQAGQVSTGYDDNSCSCLKGGYPFSHQIDTLAFYYKYAPAHSTDSASVFLSFKKNGNFIWGGNAFLLGSLNYQYFEFPFNTNTVPDTVIVQISSSMWNDSSLSYIGADLKIDEMHFKSQPLNTGINQLSFKNDKSIIIFPNPSDGKFQILSSGVSIKRLEVFNVLGEKVWTSSNFLQQSSNEINLSDFLKGIYFLKIYSGSKVQSEKIVIQ